MPNEAEQEINLLQWLARAAEVFALGTGVLLLVSLWRTSRALSSSERLVLFGTMGAGLLALQRGLRFPVTRDAQE